MTDSITQQASCDDGGPEEFARQRPYRALVTQWLRDELGSVEADNVGKEHFTALVRLAERAAMAAASSGDTKEKSNG